MNVSSMSEVIIAKYADYASMELLLEYHVPLAISQMTHQFSMLKAICRLSKDLNNGMIQFHE